MPMYVACSLKNNLVRVDGVDKVFQGDQKKEVILWNEKIWEGFVEEVGLQ